MTTLGSTVEDDRHIRQDVLIIEVLQLRQSTTVKAACSQDEDRQVGDTVRNSCVSYATEGHVVEEDEVKLLSELRCQLIEALSEEKLSGVRRYRARGDNLKLRRIGILVEDLIKAYVGVREILCSPHTSQTDTTRERTLTEVKVDEDDAVTSEGERLSEVV